MSDGKGEPMKPFCFTFSMAKTKQCEYGGNKRFSYGFCSGMAEYCHKAKKWVSDLSECPLNESLQGEKCKECGEQGELNDDGFCSKDCEKGL